MFTDTAIKALIQKPLFPPPSMPQIRVTSVLTVNEDSGVLRLLRGRHVLEITESLETPEVPSPHS